MDRPIDRSTDRLRENDLVKTVFSNFFPFFLLLRLLALRVDELMDNCLKQPNLLRFLGPDRKNQVLLL